MNDLTLQENNLKKACYWKVCDLIKNIFHEKLKNEIKYKNRLVVAFLNKRKITSEMINTYQIGFAPLVPCFLVKEFQKKLSNKNECKDFIQCAKELGYLNNNNDDFFYNRIIFPIVDTDNRTIGFGGRSLNQNEKIKYLNSKESLIFEKNNLLFNLNNYKEKGLIQKQISIVEGYMDAITLSTKCKTNENVVATLGTSFSDQQLNLLLSKNITLFNIYPDHDDPGSNHVIKIAHKLLNAKQKVVINEYDTSCKDIDELINKNKDNTIKQQNYFEWYYSKLKQQKNEIDSVKLLINELVNYSPNSFKNVFEKCLKHEGFDEEETKKYFEQQLINHTNELNVCNSPLKNINNNEKNINKNPEINSIQLNSKKTILVT